MARPRKHDVELLTHAEVGALVRACSRRAPTGARNRAMLALLYAAGLRISEALALRVRDVDMATGEVRVHRGKGGKSRVSALPPGELALVGQWLEVRRKRGIVGTAPLLCTLRGGAMDASYARHLLPRLAKRAGIEKRVHPHLLRHVFASTLATSRVPLVDVSSLLGHSSVGTTSIYLQGLIGRPEALAAARAVQWGVAVGGAR